MSGLSNIINDVKRIVSEIDGAAARDAETALHDLETEASRVHDTVAQLVTQAKADAEAVVKDAEPGVKAAVEGLISKLEADIQAALASHGL
jgi:F0F1-type ATP synthase membrane subunit b/b'